MLIGNSVAGERRNAEVSEWPGFRERRRHMRRACTVKRLAVVLAALGALTVTATPATAQQRDPFDPLVSTGSDVTEETGGVPASSESTSGSATEASTDSTVEESSLPNTGSGMSEWLAVAYALVAIGAGFVLITRILSPDDKRR
jgi:hypothetical protein